MSEHTKIFEEKMEKSINNLKNELLSVRAGRANTHVLDKVMVEAYGMQMPLNQVANISVPEARVISIQPFDASTLKAIERGINAADIGINPNSDGKVIRLVFPELDEERRKALTKDVKKLGEDCKVAVRNIRRDAMDAAKKLEKNGDITEDEKKNLETEIQKFTDKNIEAIDKAVEAKSKEVMSI
ncbi:MAG: ribosome recycling factor [Clostridia bacterium]|nr:ribosome recycling factor [Clostridia bacterium]